MTFLKIRFIFISALVLLAIIFVSFYSTSGVSASTETQFVGDEWRVISIEGEAIKENVAITLKFEKGKLSGFAGCNHYSVEYKLNKNLQILAPITNTRMLCSNPLMSLEAQYLTILSGANQALINDAGLLTILGSDGAKIIASR